MENLKEVRATDLCLPESFLASSLVSSSRGACSASNSCCERPVSVHVFGSPFSHRACWCVQQRGHDAAGANNAWMTVPAFGDWDMKNGALPDYSMDFSKIREMRKQNKRELSRASLGGDEDLLQQQQQSSKAQPPKSSAAVADDDHRRPLHDDSPTVTTQD